MSKNKSKVETAVQPAPVVPNVVTLKPIQIVQPIEFLQQFNALANSPQMFEEPVAEVEEPVKRKCGIRKVQNFFFVIALLVIVAAVVGYFMLPDFVNQLVARGDLYGSLDFKEWLLADVLLVLGGLAAIVAVVSIVIRWLLHPITCKARKGKRCCAKCEFHKYLWTFTFVGVAAFFVLAFNQVYGLHRVYNYIVIAINDFLSLGMAAVQTDMIPYIAIGAIALLFVIFVIVTLVHSARCRRAAKYA